MKRLSLFLLFSLFAFSQEVRHVVNKPLSLATIAAYTCDSTTRGQFNYIAGGAGVKDIVQVCGKDVSDVYAWRAIY